MATPIQQWLNYTFWATANCKCCLDFELERGQEIWANAHETCDSISTQVVLVYLQWFWRRSLLKCVWQP